MTEVIHTAREIEAMLPHRWPFLLVDKIIEFDAAERRIVGVKGVTGTEWFFQGHFPGMPIMPGVLQIEALAQTMGIAMAKLEQTSEASAEPKMGVFAAIDEVRFKRIVTPGDSLRLECWIDKSSRKLVKGHGIATVDGEVTCEAVMTAFVVDPRTLR